MAKPTIHIKDFESYRMVRFEIPGGVTTPEEFAEAVKEIERSLAGDKIVLITGRGPVWGYGMLIHSAHPTPAVATYDPRLSGYVVVATHAEGYYLGMVIKDPAAEA